VATRGHDERYLDPEAWLGATAPRQGSWWPVWTAWLAERSGAPVTPPAIGAAERGLPPLCAAPGCYVHAR
jgi:polyhydroxyalkanoate synthase subunit PhaC